MQKCLQSDKDLRNWQSILSNNFDVALQNDDDHDGDKDHICNNSHGYSCASITRCHLEKSEDTSGASVDQQIESFIHSIQSIEKVEALAMEASNGELHAKRVDEDLERRKHKSMGGVEELGKGKYV